MALLRHATSTIRHYSQQVTQDRHLRLKTYAVTGYLCAAVALPFIPPYLASRRTKKDGTWITRPPIKYTYRPVW